MKFVNNAGSPALWPVFILCLTLLFFISMPENPRLLSLGMNGTRSEAEANQLYGMKPRALARGVFIFLFPTKHEFLISREAAADACLHPGRLDGGRGAGGEYE